MRLNGALNVYVISQQVTNNCKWQVKALKWVKRVSCVSLLNTVYIKSAEANREYSDAYRTRVVGLCKSEKKTL